MEGQTSINLIGYPKNSIFVSISVATLLSYLTVVDLTAGAGSGSQCSNPGVLDFVYPRVDHPLISTLAIVNSNLSETRSLTFNPNFLISAEEVLFNDERGLQSSSQSTGLMLTLQEPLQARKILTSLSLADLITVLNPMVIT